MKSAPALHAKIAAFQIDRGDPRFSFSQRLAQENVWHSDFAGRVTREYLRFIYLACVSSSPVTPSVSVDQAWHLHLCYTRSYWDDLCQKVLARPLHHGPTQGGDEENLRYRLQYEHTLRIYEREFGEVPPSDIWPPAEHRFSASSSPFWISRDRFLVIEKAQFAQRSCRAGVVLLGLLGAGAAASNSDVAIFFAVFLAFVGFLIWQKMKGGKGGPGSCGASCGTGGSNSGCGADSGCGGGGCGGD